MKDEDKKRIEAVAKEYALTLVDEHEGTPQFICFKAGAEYEHKYAQQCREILKPLQNQIEEKDKRIAELEKENSRMSKILDRERYTD